MLNRHLRQFLGAVLLLPPAANALTLNTQPGEPRPQTGEFEHYLGFDIEQTSDAPPTVDDLSAKERFAVMLSALQTGEIAGAIAIAETLESQYAHNLHRRAVEAIAAVEAGQWRQATERLAELDPTDAHERASVDLARALLALRRGQLSDAEPHLQAILDDFPRYGYARALKALILEEKGQTEAAKKQLQTVLKHYPEMKVALLQLSDLTLRSGEFEQALTLAEQLTRLSPDSCTAANAEAAALLELKRPGIALESLANCPAAKHNESLILAATAHAQRGQLERASGLLRPHLEGPSHEVLAPVAARLALRRGDTAEALKWARGGNDEAHYLRSLAHLGAGDYEASLQNARAAASSSPTLALVETLARVARQPTTVVSLPEPAEADTLAPFWRLLRAQQLRDSAIDEAVAQLRQTGRLNNDRTIANLPAEVLRDALQADGYETLVIGIVFYQLQSMPLAEHFLERSEAQGGSFLSAYWLAATRHQQGEWDAAQKVLSQALELAPSYAASRHLAAELNLRLANYQQALVHYEALLAQHSNAMVALKAGALAEQVGEAERAERLYRQAIEQAPDNYLLYNQLAWFYASQERNLERGVELAKRALELAPDSSNALDTLGWLYFKQGDLVAARKALARAQESPSVLYHRAVVEEQLGNRRSAKTLLKQLVSRHPTHKYRQPANRMLQKL